MKINLNTPKKLLGLYVLTALIALTAFVLCFIEGWIFHSLFMLATFVFIIYSYIYSIKYFKRKMKAIITNY